MLVDRVRGDVLLEVATELRVLAGVHVVAAAEPSVIAPDSSTAPLLAPETVGAVRVDPVVDV